MREAALELEFDVKPLGSYRLVRKGAKRSLIELVKVSKQEEYCVRLERALGLPLNAVPRLPAHVTLFTEPGGHGIGLYRTAEMEALSSAITDIAELTVITLTTAPVWRIG